MTSSPAPRYRVYHPYEADVARFWWGLSPGSLLPLSNGRLLRLLFLGRPGGAMGPDVRDAVLCSASATQAEDEAAQRAAGGLIERSVGDVEFHIRAADWFVHGHHRDPRYNAVILHVVSLCDDASPTCRQDGQFVPVCSVQDLPLQPVLPLPEAYSWPCHCVIRNLSVDEQAKLFTRAGLLRFEQKTSTFLEQLHGASVLDLPDLYDRCLLAALAEALGYGRDRAFFRALGLRLAGLSHALPEPLGHMPAPAPLDAARLRVLHRLTTIPGIWQKLRLLLLPEHHASNELAVVLPSVRDIFLRSGLSLARTDILVCNVVYPFSAAVALLEHDAYLAERARALYLLHPGLSSNRITRLMSEQLLLSGEPRGSCQQQGLHYIYQQSCREKRCECCLVGKKDI